MQKIKSKRKREREEEGGRGRGSTERLEGTHAPRALPSAPQSAPTKKKSTIYNIIIYYCNITGERKGRGRTVGVRRGLGGRRAGRIGCDRHGPPPLLPYKSL